MKQLLWLAPPLMLAAAFLTGAAYPLSLIHI